MALTAAEQARLDELDAKYGGQLPSSNLTPQEQQRLAELDAKYGQPQLSNAPEANYSPQQALSDLSTGARSLLKTYSGGISEPVFAGLNALSQAGIDPEAFSQAYQADLERQRQQSSAPIGNIPFTDISVSSGGVNELAGALIPGSVAQRITTGVSKLAAPTAAQLIPEASQGFNLLQRGVQAAGQGAISSAGEQAVRSGAQQIEQGQFNPQQMISDIGQAGSLGGAISATVPLAGAAIKGGAKAASEVGKKAATVFGGVRGDVVEKYIKDYDAVNAAPTKEEAIKSINTFVGSLKKGVRNNEINKDQAKEALKDAVENARFTVGEDINKLRDKLNSSLVELDREYHAALGPIKEKANLQSIADDVENSLTQLKERVSQGSSKSYEILEASGTAPIKKSVLVKSLNQDLDKMRVGGVVLDEAAYNKVKDIRDKFSDINADSDVILASDAKRVIQFLDDDLSDAFNNAKFSSSTEKALINARRGIDGALKQIPGYADQMKIVAKDADLLSKARKVFKDKDAIRRSLGTITKVTQGEKARLLEELGDSTGFAFKDRLGKARQAEEILSSPQKLKGIRGILPESKKIESIKSELKEISNPRKRALFIENATKVESDAAKKAIDSYEALKSDLDQVSRLASQDGSRQSVETFISSSKDKNLELFQRLSKLSDTDFVKVLENVATKEAFTKGAGQGSRNPVIFGALGAGIGALSGSATSAAAFASLGTMLGGAVDKYGPVGTKKILDGIVSMGKNPTVSKINNLNLPEDQKKYLIQQLNIAIRQQALKD